MKQFKILSVFLFLATSYSGFSVLIDKFEDSESGFGQVDPNESELSSLGISAERDGGIGIQHNSTTGNLKYNYGKSSFISYSFTPKLNMSEIPILQIKMDSLSSGSFSNTVILTDNYDDYIHIGPQIVTNNQQYFDFSTTFNAIKYPGEGEFNFKAIKKIEFSLNSTGGVGPAYNPVTFEVESIEAVPEPFSLVSLGTGLAAFIKRKRSTKTNKTFIL